VIATWLHCEKKVFGTQYHKVTIVFLLFFANCANATTRITQLQNSLVLFGKRDTSDVFLHFLSITD